MSPPKKNRPAKPPRDGGGESPILLTPDAQRSFSPRPLRERGPGVRGCTAAGRSSKRRSSPSPQPSPVKGEGEGRGHALQ